MTLGQEQIHRGTFGGKALLALPLVVGFALGVFFSPVLLTRSEVETPAINMLGASPTGMTCLRVPTLSVNALQSTLRKNGVPPSPMERFALTSFVATRDVSMKAQAKQEFSKLDPATQSKLKKLSTAAFACLHPWVCSLQTNSTRSSIIGTRAHSYLRQQATSPRRQRRISGPHSGS